MPVSLRIIIIAIAVLNFASVVRSVRKEKIQIEHSLFWVVFSFLLIVFGVFPQICIAASRLIGIESPANFVFAFMLLVLLVRNFTLSKELSALEVKVKELTQKIALNDK